MKRVVTLFLVVAAGVAAAGLLVPARAATVGGTGVNRSDLDSQLAAIAGSPGYQCYLDALSTIGRTPQGSAPSGLVVLPVTGAGGTGTYAASFAAFWLTQMLEHQVLASLVAARHVTVTVAEVSAGRAEVASGIDQAEQLLASSGLQLPPACSESGQAVLASLPAGFVDQLARAQADTDWLQQQQAGYQPGAAGERHYYDAHRAVFDTVCTQIFVVPTQTAATALQSRADSGVPLRVLVAGIPAQAGSGTRSECFEPSSQSYGTVAQATTGLNPGQITQPLADNGSYVLLYLISRSPTPFSAVRAQVHQAILGSGSSATQQLVAQALHRDGVHVDPRFGRWSSVRGLVPPSTPPSHDVPSSSADLAPSTAPGQGLPALAG